MEVLACIPALPASPLPDTAGVEDRDETSAAVDSVNVSPAAPVRVGVRRRPARASGPFSASIVALAAVATLVWAAALRNEQSRLEAARRQRPERLAQELPSSAGRGAGHTP